MQRVYLKYFVWGLCKDPKKEKVALSGSLSLILKENYWDRDDRPLGMKYCITDKTLIMGGSIKDAGVIEHLLYTYFSVDREVIHTTMQDVSRNKVKVRLILDKVDFYTCIENMRANSIMLQKVFTFGRLFR